MVAIPRPKVAVREVNNDRNMSCRRWVNNMCVSNSYLGVSVVNMRFGGGVVIVGLVGCARIIGCVRNAGTLSRRKIVSHSRWGGWLANA